MPQTRKVTWAQLRVGVMAIVAIAIMVVLVFLITGRRGFFTKTAEIRTFVDDSSLLKVGSPVRLNGIDIGNVRSVALSGQTGRRTIEIKIDIILREVQRPQDLGRRVGPLVADLITDLSGPVLF